MILCRKKILSQSCAEKYFSAHDCAGKNFSAHDCDWEKNSGQSESMDMGPDGLYKYTGLTHKMHRKCMICMHFLCQCSVLMRPPYDTAHCIVWWPGASFGGQAPRWYPRFTLGDLFVTTLRVKWPGASFGGQAPRWYPRFVGWAEKKEKKKGKRGAIHSGQSYK